ncbi:MAG: anthranilate phosphoribosyltransferase [Gammaproteobacteria bacterium]
MDPATHTQATQKALQLASQRQNVPIELMKNAVKEMASEHASAPLTAALLAALTTKGESSEEIEATARVLRERGIKLKLTAGIRSQDLLDNCGTGGTGQSLFNCSTCSAVIAAAAGVKVAKHGNRTNTRASGSADLLEQAGINLDMQPDQAALCLQQTGLTFLFAPAFHPSMRYVGPVRREIGIKSIFNLVGPLANPANAGRQVLGLFSAERLQPMATALQRLGTQKALVLHSEDGLDEISPIAPTLAIEITATGTMQQHRIQPEHYIKPVQLVQLKIHSVAESLHMIKQVLSGQLDHPASAMVALNAGAALWIGGRCNTLGDGVELARSTIASGDGMQVLNQLAQLSHQTPNSEKS